MQRIMLQNYVTVDSLYQQYVQNCPASVIYISHTRRFGSWLNFRLQLFWKIYYVSFNICNAWEKTGKDQIRIISFSFLILYPKGFRMNTMVQLPAEI